LGGLTGYEDWPPAPDGYHAVIGAGEEIQASNILGIECETASLAPKFFFIDPVTLIHIAAYWASNGCSSSIDF